MKIIEVRKGNLDIEYNGKIIRCWGDLCVNGFSVLASTMEYISSETSDMISETERTEIITEVKKYCKENKKFKIIFLDDRGKKI